VATASTPPPRVENTFEVVYAGDFPPALDLRTPVNGATVAIPQGLSPMLLSAFASVEHADILSADRIHFEIGNETVVAQNHQNGHFTAWWTPLLTGTYNMTVKAFNSEDYFTAYNSTFDVVNSSANKTQRTFDQTWLLTGNGLKDTMYTLPAHVGAYDQIIGKLYITCPPGGCDPLGPGVQYQGEESRGYLGGNHPVYHAIRCAVQSRN
jgi:hypothetical protein